MATSPPIFPREKTMQTGYGPALLIAVLMGHREDAELLEFEDSAKMQTAPNVSFY